MSRPVEHRRSPFQACPIEEGLDRRRQSRLEKGLGMATSGRIVSAVVLLLVATFRVYQAIAARESGARLAYWLIDRVVGRACVVGASWLFWPKAPRY
jgi:hypothetical protein